MGRPRTFDEEELLDRAVELFWEHGYEATSIADLEQHLGMGRQSLYNAFGDKQELFSRALKRYSEVARQHLAESLLGPDAGLAEIRAFFGATVDRLTGKGGRRGCFVANSILESPEACPEATTQCQQNQRQVKRAFVHVLKSAVVRGEIRPEFDVLAGANLLLAQVYGLTVMSKAGATPRELRTTVNALMDRL